MKDGIWIELDGTFDDVLARVPAALATEGFGVLTQIDVQKTLKDKINRDIRPYRILGACNPTFAHEAISISPEIGLRLPCNVERADCRWGHRPRCDARRARSSLCGPFETRSRKALTGDRNVGARNQGVVGGTRLEGAKGKWRHQ